MKFKIQRIMKSIQKHIDKAKFWTKSILEKDKVDLDQKEEDDYNSLIDGRYESWRNETIVFFDKDQAKKKINEKIFNEKKENKPLKIFRYWQSAVAASVLVMLVSGAYFLYQDLISLPDNSLLQPGESIAYLEIDNEERIELGLQDTLLLFDETKAKLGSGKVVYSSTKTKQVVSQYHKISIPRNGEYYVELSDGTKVWVNSESIIGFYSRFTEKERVVDLVGEAYFEVAKNIEQPFIVRTAKSDIRVLGTQFNVKSYPDEEYTYTTLNEGRVRVSSGTANENLVPDEQLIVNNLTGDYTKIQVDANIYSAWVKGQFVFKDERLEDILLAVSRWYDVEIFYTKQELKEERYSISMTRYENVLNLLEHIELAESIKFEVKGKALIVKQY